MKKKKPMKKISEDELKEKIAKEKVENEELPSLSHLDLEDALKKAMEVPWSDDEGDE